MRSIIVFLRDTTEATVTAYLDAAYPAQRDPWVLFAGDDACLYIDLYRDGPIEFKPEEWDDIVQQFGDQPVAVGADVSGRHPGDQQVIAFVAGLLSHFSGGAMDDYTRHLWSLAEIRAGHLFAGHPFFDYDGWYAETR